MRIFLGFLVAAVALGGAVWLHESAKFDRHPATCVAAQPRFIPDEPCRTASGDPGGIIPGHNQKADWQDAVAVVLAVAGVGAGVALVAGARGSHENLTGT